MARTRGVVLLGVDGHVIGVEAHISIGVSGFSVVGMADKLVGEARDRCRSAVINTGLDWPGPRNTVGLSPAELPKRGPTLDLAIALALLSASGQVPGDAAAELVVVGELGLDGRVRPVRGALVAALAARDAGARRLVVPSANVDEAALVPGLEVHGVRTLAGLVALVRGDAVPDIELDGAHDDLPPPPPAHDVPDLVDVRGQHAARSALELAAAGGHHLAMSGSPGVGKTMLAERLPGLLPPLDEQAALEVTAIHSVAGRLATGGRLITVPPFEAPHHTATHAAMVGGGSGVPRIGLVSLAHRGVLFLDEAPEFDASALEALRQPLESGVMLVARSAFSVRFPARFHLILAMNPCPCGRGDSGLSSSSSPACVCTPQQRRRYLARISGPLLDRIDLRVSLVRPTLADLEFGSSDAEPTSAVADRVRAARERAARRYRDTPWRVNAEVPGPVVRRQFGLDADAAVPLDTALSRGFISARGADRVVRVAWTLADLAGRSQPSRSDIGAALHHRDGGTSWAA
ncbi:MAG: YifB family Mg chelatase-like AAA ATPase [Actinobacteria bacterium]|nr:YifB family Mg chelatase-like AAA ATPase [Actinomycetota bacterium]